MRGKLFPRGFPGDRVVGTLYLISPGWCQGICITGPSPLRHLFAFLASLLVPNSTTRESRAPSLSHRRIRKIANYHNTETRARIIPRVPTRSIVQIEIETPGDAF